MKLLLENGASPNDETCNRKTPLHLAAMYGNAECLRLLLEDERCDPNNIVYNLNLKELFLLLLKF